MNKSFINKIGVIIFWIILLGVSLYFYITSIAPYFTGGLSQRQKGEKWWLIVHFSGAACTLILGPLQFWPYFRNHYKSWHRLAGKPGSIPSLGFLAIIWLFTTIIAFWFAVKRNFKLHKQFMIRSYVCGFAFVFMKNEEVQFTVYEWLCWVYPLMITEFILVWWPSVSKYKLAKR